MANPGVVHWDGDAVDDLWLVFTRKLFGRRRQPLSDNWWWGKRPRDTHGSARSSFPETSFWIRSVLSLITHEEWRSCSRDWDAWVCWKNIFIKICALWSRLLKKIRWRFGPSKDVDQVIVAICFVVAVGILTLCFRRVQLHVVWDLVDPVLL